MGCFEDKPDARDLTGYHVTLKKMRRNNCLLICSEKGFRFAGVQNG